MARLAAKPPRIAVNDRHPLARDLIVAIPFMPGSGHVLPIWTIGGWVWLPFDGAAPTPVVRQLGATVSYGSRGYDGVVGSFLPSVTGGRFSILTAVWFDTGFYNDRLLLALGDSTGTVADIVWFGIATNTLRLNLNGTGDTGGSLSTGNLYVAACTNDGSTTKLYLDGAEVGSASRSLTVNSGATSLRVGRDYYTGSQNWDTYQYATYLWRRALSAAEVAQLSADPFLLIRPVPATVAKAADAPVAGARPPMTPLTRLWGT